MSAAERPSSDDPQSSTEESPRFFYGWVIVFVMGASGAVSMAMGSLNFGLFIKPMGDDLGIGRAAFGWAQTARQGAGALSSPIIGPLLDRFGSRAMLPFAAAVTGSGDVWSGQHAGRVAPGRAVLVDRIRGHERPRGADHIRTGAQVVRSRQRPRDSVHVSWHPGRSCPVRPADADTYRRGRLEDGMGHPRHYRSRQS